MSNKTDAKRVFISYSWNPVQNQSWVIELAERLVSDGIDVTLDVWDLEEGQNKYKFMEQMVNDPKINKVLVICNKEYAEKADSNTGGVGNETTIISPEIYKNVNQTKFLPLIRDFKEDNDPCVPVFMKGAKYLDFSSKEKFEEEYEKLLRNILGKPSRKKPPLGNVPSHLENEESFYLRTSKKAERIKDSMINNNVNVNSLILDYFDTFMQAFDDIKVVKSSNEIPIDELVIESIEKSLELRNDFLKVIEYYSKYSTGKDHELVHNIFEEMLNDISSKDIELRNTGGSEIIDNYKFLIWELFLYTCAIIAKHDRFDILKELLSTPYYVVLNELYNKEYRLFNAFSLYIVSLDNIRNRRLNLNRTSVAADTIRKRANLTIVNFGDLMQIDTFLYYVSLLNEDSTKSRPPIWFPRLSVYAEFGLEIDLMKRAKSKRFFEKLKMIFDVRDVNELKEKIKKFEEGNEYRNFGYGFHIPTLPQGLRIDLIGTIN